MLPDPAANVTVNVEGRKSQGNHGSVLLFSCLEDATSNNHSKDTSHIEHTVYCEANVKIQS